MFRDEIAAIEQERDKFKDDSLRWKKEAAILRNALEAERETRSQTTLRCKKCHSNEGVISMKQPKITDPIKAQASIAYLIANGFKIDLFELNRDIPGGLQSDDWIAIAEFCATFVFDELAKQKVIPLNAFAKRKK